MRTTAVLLLPSPVLRSHVTSIGGFSVFTKSTWKQLTRLLVNICIATKMRGKQKIQPKQTDAMARHHEHPE